MNTLALKAFAPGVRRDLMEAVDRKLDVVLAARTPDYRTTFAPQVAALGALARDDRAGLVERVAYTWFNRLTALRYLDARGWHPFRARVLTAAAAGEAQPELLKRAREGALPPELARHTDPARLDDLLDGRVPSGDAQGEVYRHLVLAACRFYHALLPDLFERLDDATELLLPDDLLTEHSVAHGFRTAITDEDCVDVELLGWLYQFYISEKKDEVMARKAAVPTADIPAVTQLFTPHWIVRYLVENSLGRLWLLNRPQSRLREQMPYYIEGEPETDFLKIEKPEEIRVLDPAVGSGHMLTYAFDLLYAIYEGEGYAPSEIPGLILQHNLYGVDIDPRAAQLAELALVLKARERSRRFFQPEMLVKPHVIALENVRFDDSELREYMGALGLGPLFNEPVRRLLTQFEEATTFGSLIQPVLRTQDIEQLRRAVLEKHVDGQIFLSKTYEKVLQVLTQAGYLACNYHVVIANPPYLKGGFMGRALKSFAEVCFSDSKANLYAMFLERSLTLLVKRGLLGTVNLHGWMFTSRYEKLRGLVLRQTTLLTMAHLGANAFDEVSGEVVQVTAFALKNVPNAYEARTHFFRLVEARDETEKNQALLDRRHAFVVPAASFRAIAGEPIAYWLSDAARAAFTRFAPIAQFAEIRAGLQTGDNETFLRYWHEVSYSKVGLRYRNRDDARDSGRKWFPHNKGGLYRRWYGNGDYLILWENDGQALKGRKAADLRAGLITANNSKCWNQEFYFQDGFSWTALSTGNMSARDNGFGFLFDTKGQTVFPSDPKYRAVVLGFLNSSLSTFFLEALSPTLDFNGGTVAKLPIPVQVGEEQPFQRAVEECVALARADWDNYETSWDFLDLPLLRTTLKDGTLTSTWKAWQVQCGSAVRRMQQLETENNRRLLAAFGLNEDLRPDVPEHEITLARADRRRDAAAFLSFAVGCMMGRYSLERPGLILADAGDTLPRFAATVGKPVEALTFAPDVDAIIPVLDGEWFEEDIVARTREFLRATFGEAMLRENVRWLEESLGKDLRKYFLTDFYRDHLQTYKKRPIYWLVQSPRRGFSVIVYLHRYTRDTLNVVLNGYLREYLGKLRGRLEQLAQTLAGDTLSARDKTAARKEADRLTKVVHECEEWERQALLPLAQQRITLDLDDGVKVNYLKLGDVLAPIPGLAAAEE